MLESEPMRSRLFRGRVGFLTHPAAITSGWVHGASALRARGQRFEILFGPEHGYGGEAQDMASVGDARDAEGTIVRSLYGDNFEDLIPKDDDLARVDTLVVDMQDVGSRYYTFVWTAVCALRACAKRGARVVVLDRPNPIGGAKSSLEGRLQNARFCSFVGPRADADSSRPHARRDRRVAARGREARRPARDRPLRVGSRAPIVLLGGALGAAVSEHADARHRARLSGRMSASKERTSPRAAARRARSRSSARRSSTAPRLARELRHTRLPGFHARPLHFLPTFHKHANVPAAACRST